MYVLSPSEPTISDAITWNYTQINVNGSQKQRMTHTHTPRDREQMKKIRKKKHAATKCQEIEWVVRENTTAMNINSLWNVKDNKPNCFVFSFGLIRFVCVRIYFFSFFQNNRQVVTDAMYFVYFVSFPFLWLCLDLPIVNDIHFWKKTTSKQTTKSIVLTTIRRLLLAGSRQMSINFVSLLFFHPSLSLFCFFLFDPAFCQMIMWFGQRRNDEQKKREHSSKMALWLVSIPKPSEKQTWTCTARTEWIATTDSYRHTGSVDVWGNDNFGHFYLCINSMP